ncbi:MAG TPA: glycosyltransferase [[Clostridium] spiroforme]|uniref:Glycosyltransferase n=1 Tax=Thomasclavelia spiroformis TaxID=29348 RepID=A0A921GAH5_9FIRM|nr:glycosyltransferase [Thomasclavelia spiroformis]
MYINILLPVLNEEKRLEKGVVNTIHFLNSIHYNDYQLTIVDNGSSDQTSKIAMRLTENYNFVKYIRLEEKGVGIAVQTGVNENKSDIVGYMDIDLSTDIRHLEDIIKIFSQRPDIDIINGSRLNKNSNTVGRKWYRNITSKGLSFVLKLFLHMKATDAICGFKFFRKDAIDNLIKYADSEEKGWFYVIELLLRAERMNYKILELPVHWEDDYNTTVHVWKLIKNYMKNIFRLRKKFKKEQIL